MTKQMDNYYVHEFLTNDALDRLKLLIVAMYDDGQYEAVLHLIALYKTIQQVREAMSLYIPQYRDLLGIAEAVFMHSSTPYMTSEIEKLAEKQELFSIPHQIQLPKHLELIQDKCIEYYES